MSNIDSKKLQPGVKVRLIKNKLLSGQIRYLKDNNLWNNNEIFGEIFKRSNGGSNFMIIFSGKTQHDYMPAFSTERFEIADDFLEKHKGHPLTSIFR